jgi:hypothetical protein
MQADCCRSRGRVARRAGLSILPGVLLVLAPKCPLCIAAYLAAFGLSTGAASAVAPWLRPGAALLFGIAIAVTVYELARRAHSKMRSGSPRNSKCIVSSSSS